MIHKPFGQSAVTDEIGEDGMIRAGRVKNCDGLALQQLRERGRAFDHR